MTDQKKKYSEDADQAAHARSLIKVQCLPEDSLDTWLPAVCPAKTYETAQIRMLSRVLSGRTCCFVINAVSGLI